MRQNRNLRAFTLIELLIVISIILLLAALTVAVGMRYVRERSMILATSHRMQQVLTGLAQYSTSSDLPERLQRVTGFNKQFVSLKSAISLLTDKYGLDIVSATKGTYPLPASSASFTYPSNGQLPPGIGSRWENLIARTNAAGTGLWDNASAPYATPLDSRKFWPNQSAGLEDVITFMDRQIGRTTSATLGNNPISYWKNLAQYTKVTGDFWMMVAWDDVSQVDLLGPYGSNLVNSVGGMTARRGTNSPRGESLKGTLEIKPDAIRSASWYMQQWPNLVETQTLDASSQFVYFQSAWPASDWDQAAPGSIPLVWHWPWGKQLFSRTRGTMIDQIEYINDGSGILKSRTLADLNPLSSIELLQAAGILAPGEEGRTAYRTDRGKNRNWNDAWGGPLVVGCASFLPARYDFDDVNDTMVNGVLGTKMPKDSRTMLGGRDFLMKKSLEVNQYQRSFYTAVGAPGSTYSTVLTGSTWIAADDRVNLRALWKHVCTVTSADEWDGAAFVSPPWKEVRHKTYLDGRCFISTPVEYK
jgi:prepilin-type N-terminal cleavage/methylation domain-containing protein